ncbi:hypothetical protein [Bradyrhizobium sp. SK17]|uniref:hypothetical protein n=1 Tax=Bradyrhizobium sp. SK17 TaxID=2057741 RepID=UPI0012FDB1AD|nr:hypothetical protein [Bradyrhizobium sp. SK17]
MRIAILGQSNSILKEGFFNKFLDRHQPIDVVSTGRVGASPSLLGPYFADRAFFRNAEFCIVDMCAIDFSLLSAGAIGLYDVVKWIEWIGHSAKRNGCEPIFVCIPVSTVEYSKHLISNCISVFERNEWFYLDVRDCIAQLLEGGTGRPETLYKDPSHPGVELSELIADSLKELIDEIRAMPMVAVDRMFPITRFEVINLQDRLAAPVANYKTSLIEFRGVRLERGKSYELKLGGISALSGMMLNSAACKGVLEIEGDRKFNKNLRLRAYHPTPVEVRLVPICKPLRDADGTIALTVVDGAATESDTTFHSTKAPEDDLGFVEASEIMVERGYDLFTYGSRRPANGQMLRWAPKSARKLAQVSWER